MTNKDNVLSLYVSVQLVHTFVVNVYFLTCSYQLLLITVVEKPKKKLKFLQQTSQKLSHAISNVLRTNQNSLKKKEEKSPLKELYNDTFKIEQVADLNNKFEKKSQQT